MSSDPSDNRGIMVDPGHAVPRHGIMVGVPGVEVRARDEGVAIGPQSKREAEAYGTSSSS